MGFFSGLYEIVKKILGWVVLPIFKFLRKLLWDWTLRKFFNDVLKVTFLVGLVDDFLDVVEALIEDPADLFVMTNKSAWIIVAPWIVNILLIPINKIKNAAVSASMNTQEVQAPAAPIEQQPTMEPAGEPTIVEGEVPVQEGGSFINMMTATPDIKTYFGFFFIVFLIYFLEKKDLCNQNKTKDGKEKWNSWNLTKYSFWFGIFITAFYAACFTVFPYFPIVGIFFRIVTKLPLVGKVVPGLITYFAYNVLRNITEVMKKRTHCTMK